MKALRIPQRTSVMIRAVPAVNHAEVGACSRSLRNEAGVTVAELAREMKIDKGTISRLETGNRKWNSDRVSKYISALSRAKQRKPARK